MTISQSDQVIHKVLDEWHYPILTRYGFKPQTMSARGLVRRYSYKNPQTGVTIVAATGCSADYWESSTGHFGYVGTLEAFLQTN
jgi:hypothetical protein